jgi:hypothetical protein
MIIITQSYSDLLRPKVSRTCIRTWKYSKIHVPLNLDVHLFFITRQRPGSTHPGSFVFDHHTISDLKLPATEEEEEKTTQETKGK